MVYSNRMQTYLYNFFLYIYTSSSNSSNLSIIDHYVCFSGSGILYYMPRSGWNAAPPKDKTYPLKKPVNIVALFDTAVILDDCRLTEDCCDQLTYLQKIAFNGTCEVILGTSRIEIDIDVRSSKFLITL